MPIVASRSNASAFGYGWSAGAPEVLGGMVLITPTSVDKAGTGSTATIVSSGSVEFDSCTSLSLNGVFSATYDNYMIVLRGVASTTHTPMFRLRTSGSDASGSNYTYQYVYAASTSVTASRVTTTGTYPMSISATRENGSNHYLYGPFLSQATAGRSVTQVQTDGAQLWDLAWTHSLATSYDGFSLVPTSPYTITGLISVYGLVGA